MANKSTEANTPRRMTKKEIALACGVSRITLDRVLNNMPGVGEETREKILSFLQKNEYRENRLAQSLVRGRSRSFGIIVFDLGNSFYAQLVNAFQCAAQEAGYVSYIMLSNKDPQREKALLEDLLARQVEGIVVNSVVKEADYGRYLNSQGIPILSVMNQVSRDLPFLGFDERASMRELVRYALDQGYRRFFYVCPPLARALTSNMDSLLRRKQGFDDEVKSCPQAEASIGFADATQ
jgi:DNA-binding LacI/PurR family transcriptional regulator